MCCDIVNLFYTNDLVGNVSMYRSGGLGCAISLDTLCNEMRLKYFIEILIVAKYIGSSPFRPF